MRARSFSGPNLRVVEGLAVATVLCARLSGHAGAMKTVTAECWLDVLERARGDRHSGARSWAEASVLLSAQGRAPVQPVLSTAAGAKRVSVGVRRWGNFRGLSQARRRTLAADDRPARLDH